MEHGKKAAKAYSKLIRQTTPKEGKAGKNRSLALGQTPAQPVLLVSAKRPSAALNELKAMSKKQGSVAPLALGQVVFEEGIIHVKVFKPTGEAPLRKAFLAYFKAYGVAPPSQKIQLWQPDQWDATEFEEDPEDADEDEDADDEDEEDDAAEDDAADGGDDDADEDEEDDGEADDAETSPDAAERAARSQATLAALSGGVKNAARQIAARPEIRPLIVAASGQLKLAGEHLAAGRQDDTDQALEAAKGAMARIAAQVRTSASSGPRPLDLWRAAKEETDQRLAALIQAMLRYPAAALRSGLKELADKGLNGVTDRASVGMMAALTEAEASPQTRAQALQAVANFRAFLQTPVAGLIDENPFGVAVDLRGRLGAALDAISGRLAG